MKNVEIRPSELQKVPVYTQNLEKVIQKSHEIGLEKALEQWALEIKERRIKWYEDNKDRLNLRGTEVRKGFQLVMLDYMGINPNELIIVEENKNKIIWKAYDFCPYFEAIKNKGMDTKMVCKYATEMPIQALLDVFNPKLKFSRNYQKIRPYVEYCEETIELIED